MKCLKQWTVHTRVTYYKHQFTYNVEHIKCNKGTCPNCRIKYGDEDILLWKLYEVKKNRLIKLAKSQEKIDDEKQWRKLNHSPKIQWNDKILHLPSTYAKIWNSRMTLSEMFDLIQRADRYVLLLQFLRDAKITHIPYVEITVQFVEL